MNKKRAVKVLQEDVSWARLPAAVPKNEPPLLSEKEDPGAIKQFDDRKFYN